MHPTGDRVGYRSDDDVSPALSSNFLEDAVPATPRWDSGAAKLHLTRNGSPHAADRQIGGTNEHSAECARTARMRPVSRTRTVWPTARMMRPNCRITCAEPVCTPSSRARRSMRWACVEARIRGLRPGCPYDLGRTALVTVRTQRLYGVAVSPSPIADRKAQASTEALRVCGGSGEIGRSP